MLRPKGGAESETELAERKMFLQLPEEKPLIRRSTSPTIKITSDTEGTR